MSALSKVGMSVSVLLVVRFGGRGFDWCGADEQRELNRVEMGAADDDGGGGSGAVTMRQTYQLTMILSLALVGCRQ